MTTVAAGEGCLPPTATAWPNRVGAGDGLVAAVATDADPCWADLVLATDVTGILVWSHSHSQVERHGMRTLERPGVQAVSLAPAGSNPCQVRVAMQLSKRLGRQRAGAAGRAPACLTSPTTPAIPDGLVRIPHLVTIRSDSQALTDRSTRECADTVVWELTTQARAVRWLGGPLPDQNLIEARLPHLLALRTAARTGLLPPTGHGARLAELLHGRPQPLSIWLVYRHLDLFCDLFAEAPAAAGVMAQPGNPQAERSTG